MLEFLIVPFFVVGVTTSARGMRIGNKFVGGGGLAADKEAQKVKADFVKAREEFLKGNEDGSKMRELAEKLQDKAPLAGKGKGKSEKASVPAGNPNFQNRTFQLDLDSVPTAKGGNPAAIKKAAEQYSKLEKFQETSMIDFASIASTGKASWSPDKIEAVAKSIAANNGTVLRIPVAQRSGIKDGESQFKVVAGANEIKAYQRARELNPNIPDRVRVYVGDPKALAPLRTPPVVRRIGVANGEEQYEVVGNVSNFKGFQQARKLNPNLPDRFRGYILGKGETIDSLRPQLDD